MLKSVMFHRNVEELQGFASASLHSFKAIALYTSKLYLSQGNHLGLEEAALLKAFIPI